MVGNLRTEELKLERDYEAQLKIYKPDWPAMVTLKGEIERTKQHIAASRQLLQRAGGQGFPTFVLAQAGGPASRIDIGPWLGRADEWKAQLAATSRRQTTASYRRSKPLPR